MFKILNIQSFSYVSQRPVGGIEKHVRTFVILWSYPLPFQDSQMFVLYKLILFTYL